MPTFRNQVNAPEEPAAHAISVGERSIALLGQGKAVGVRGDGGSWHGVAGISTSTTGGAGVNGTGHIGVQGVGQTWIGVHGETHANADKGASGVLGDGREGGDGVTGHAHGPGKAAVRAVHLSGRGPGVVAVGFPAGRFEGEVVVSGNLMVRNVDVLRRIGEVESAAARRAADLERDVESLRSTVSDLRSRMSALESRTAPR